MKNASEIVVITGGSGFLGQHLVRVLQERDPLVKEIRIVDLLPYENRLHHPEGKKIVSYIGDICDTEKIREAFEGGVSCVFHLAAYINFDFPPNYDELRRVNVEGTQNIVNLCIANNIPRLVYSSTTLVTMLPYMGHATFSLICNQTESKTSVGQKDEDYFVPGYPFSKLCGEDIVLQSNGAALTDGVCGCLKTVSLRPTVMYGEEDNRFFPSLIKIGERFNGTIPKIAGVGGKPQITYAGNVAWSLIRAKDTLEKSPDNVAGLPIFVTDDTPMEDITRFCQRISRSSKFIRLRPSWYSIPAFATYFLCFILETIMKYVLYPLFKIKLNFSPRAVVAYISSLLLYNRLRASIQLHYDPIFNEELSITNSANWYDKWYLNNVKKS